MFGISIWYVIAIAVVVFLVAQNVYFVVVCAWADRATNGVKYYGRSLAQRRRFKRALSLHAAALSPLLFLLSRAGPARLDRATFVYKGVAGPKGSCGEESFQKADQYRPTSKDIFVATQMKCGTTWMQHVVFQVLTRGNGDLVGAGHALYAISPWIEARKSVPLQDAPLIGLDTPNDLLQHGGGDSRAGAERLAAHPRPARRIIKTHLPTAICPYSDQAQYIYVVRHPVSCFASAVDFLRMNVGPFHIPLEALEQWYCSSQMWWGTWPDHVLGWWRWARQRPNVLFIRFEDMKSDLKAAVIEVAEFLGVADLNESELERIVYQCSFGYMQEHAEMFEMSVPTVLSGNLRSFVSGAADRHRSVPEDVQQRLLRWCGTALEGTEFPLEQFYPDAAASAGA